MASEPVLKKTDTLTAALGYGPKTLDRILRFRPRCA